MEANNNGLPAVTNGRSGVGPGPGTHWITAEVAGFADLVEAGSMMAVRSAGTARVEGKE